MKRVGGNGQLHLLYKTRFCTEIESCYMTPILTEKKKSTEEEMFNASPTKSLALCMMGIMTEKLLMHSFNKQRCQVAMLTRCRVIVRQLHLCRLL